MSKAEKLINALLCLFILVLPWQTRWIWRWGEIGGGYSEYLRVSLYASDILLALFLSAFFAYWLMSRRPEDQPRIRSLWLIIASLELVILISLLGAADRVLAWYKYALFLAGIGLFFAASQHIIRRLLPWLSLIAAGVLQAVLGIIQFFYQGSWANKWLGLAAHDPAMAGTAIVLDQAGGRYLRAYGAFDHPNILGGFLAICLLGAALLWLWRGFGQQRWLRIFLLASLPLLSAGLFFSFSRAAWLAAAAGFAYLAALSLFRPLLVPMRRLVLVSAIPLLTVFFLPLAAVELVQGRLQADTGPEIRSLDQRSEHFREAGDLIGANFWLGVGPGNYISALAGQDPERAWYDYQPVHNVFMLTWAELGIFGFMLFFGLIYYLGLSQLALPQNAILLALFILMMLDHWLWSLHFGLLFFWLVTAMAYQPRPKAG